MRYLSSNAFIHPNKITDLDSAFAAYFAGQITHDILAARSAHAYAAALAGSQVDDVERAAKLFATTESSEFFPDSLAVLDELRKRKIHTLVISGAPEEILREHAHCLGINRVIGLQLGVSHGKFSGTICRNPGLKEEKERFVKQVIDAASGRIVLAMGNSDSDTPLFEAANFSVIVGESVHILPARFARLDDSRLFQQLRRQLDGG